MKNRRILLLLFIALAALFILSTRKSSVGRMLRHEERINILLLGCDELMYSKHSDVVMLLSYEPRTKFLDILSIPRDTKVPRYFGDHWRPYQKINEVYAGVYSKTKDARQSCVAVNSTIGNLLEMDIPYYFQLDYNSFRDVIDVLGGIDINIEKKMDYDDNWGNLHIHFKPGKQKLSGKKSLEYVRYRDKVYGDVGRIARQHKFLNALSKQVKNVKVLFRLPGIYKAIVKNTWTNLRLQDLLLFAMELRDISQRDFRVQNLPGIPRALIKKNYWVTDKEKVDDIVQVINNSYRENVKDFKLSPSKEMFDDVVEVEVWNATNRKGLAKGLQVFMRKFGIDAVRWGNYGSLKRYTTVIDRRGNLDLAHKVAKVIGCSEVKTAIDRDRLVDLSIVIGNDFKEVYEEKD